MTDKISDITNASISGFLFGLSEDIVKWANLDPKEFKPGADLSLIAKATMLEVLSNAFSCLDPSTSPFWTTEDPEEPPFSGMISDQLLNLPSVDKDGYPSIFYEDFVDAVPDVEEIVLRPEKSGLILLGDLVSYIADVIANQSKYESKEEIAGFLDSVAADLQDGQTREKYNEDTV